MTNKDRIIGMDFDNTIIIYDEFIHRAAVQRGLIAPNIEKSKKHIRDSIRQLPGGEIEWQRLQANVYGFGIAEAKLANGVEEFFKLCSQHGNKVYIVSHKTEFANFDETGTNLRTAAVNWMRSNRIFTTDGLGLSERNVYFESTRAGKIKRLMTLECTHFIDDLEETFLEGCFPTNVEKILYSPHMDHSSIPTVRVFSSWKEISHYFFGETNGSRNS